MGDGRWEENGVKVVGLCWFEGSDVDGKRGEERLEIMTHTMLCYAIAFLFSNFRFFFPFSFFPFFSCGRWDRR
jgi:hypothetical protein